MSSTACWRTAPKLVRSGGRIVVITFMSLEDRKVKQSFQELAREGRGRILTKHVVRPSEKEVMRIRRPRSAKLRAWKCQWVAVHREWQLALVRGNE